MPDPIHPEGKLVKAAISYNGKVYTGWRHSDIRMSMFDQGISQETIQSITSDPWNVGFITENGRFLTRKQALPYARMKKQIDTIAGAELTSEDLWEDDGTPK